MQSENYRSRAVCFTGHRPEKFPFDVKNELYLKMFKSLIYMHALDAVRDGCDTFYCGMQRGMDIWAGQQILNLKRIYPSVKLICVSPFEREISSRRGKDYDDYVMLRDNCDEFVTLGTHYRDGCFFERNRYMVDRSGYIIGAIADPKSGTAQTLAYAERQGLKVHRIDLKRFAEDYNLH